MPLILREDYFFHQHLDAEVDNLVRNYFIIRPCLLHQLMMSLKNVLEGEKHLVARVKWFVKFHELARMASGVQNQVGWNFGAFPTKQL